MANYLEDLPLSTSPQTLVGSSSFSMVGLPSSFVRDDLSCFMYSMGPEVRSRLATFLLSLVCGWLLSISLLSRGAASPSWPSVSCRDELSVGTGKAKVCRPQKSSRTVLHLLEKWAFMLEIKTTGSLHATLICWYAMRAWCLYNISTGRGRGHSAALAQLQYSIHYTELLSSLDSACIANLFPHYNTVPVVAGSLIVIV